MDQGGARRARLVEAAHRRQRLIANRQVHVPYRRDRRACAHERHHRIAPVAHEPLGQHRLVSQVGVDADAVVGHVDGGEYPLHAGPRSGRRLQIAALDLGRVMGRADDAEPERVPRDGIGAVALGTGELGLAVELGEAGADGGPRRGRCQGQRGVACSVEHRGHDLAVAGAATEHAAEPVHHLCLAGARRGAQQFGCGNQHARRARAALGRAVAQEGPLQAVEASLPGEALHGFHVAPCGLGHGHHAAAHLGAVEQHRAGAAVAGVAAYLGAGEPEIVAERVGEAPERRRRDRDRFPVDREGDGTVPAHIMLPSSASVRAVSVRAASRR